MAIDRHHTNRYRGLLVDESSEAAFAIADELERGGLDVNLVRVARWEAIQEALDEKAWDVIICNYCLPEHDGLEVLAGCRKRGLDIPFLMISARLGEEVVVAALKAGAHDYVLQEQFSRLAPAVSRELQAAQERRIRQECEARSAYLALMVESCNEAIVGKTLDGTILSWNLGAQRLYGYTALEMIGRSISQLIPTHRPDELPELLARLKRGECLENFETVRVRKDGSRVDVSLTLSPIRDAAGRIIGASSVAHDITRRKQDEEERLRLLRDLTEALAMKNTEAAATAGEAPAKPSRAMPGGRVRAPVREHLPDSFPT